jgi:tetratricopeptide (TPR) repeat protein
VWSDVTPSRLLRDLERIKCVRSGSLPIPVPLRLQFRDDLIWGLSTTEITLNLRKALLALPNALTLTADPHSAFGTIFISNDEIGVNLAGMKGMTLHLKGPYGADAARTVLHYDVLVASALTLCKAGCSDLAAKMLNQFAAFSSLIVEAEIAVMVAHCMVQAQRVNEALSLAQALLADPRSRIAAFTLMLSMLVRSSSMSKSERALLTQFLEGFVTSEERTGSATSAATANYNLGNHLRSISSYRAAFRHYRRASKFDPKYYDRGHFCRELASVLFLSRKYRVAAKLYGRAIRLGEGGTTRALQADALMFSGRYSDALEQFEAYVAAENAPQSEFILKAWALKNLQQTLNISHQTRQKILALELASPKVDLAENLLTGRLEKALGLDASCGLAWFNLGTLLNRQGKRDDACAAYLCAALVQAKDAEPGRTHSCCRSPQRNTRPLRFISPWRGISRAERPCLSSCFGLRTPNPRSFQSKACLPFWIRFLRTLRMRRFPSRSDCWTNSGRPIPSQ